MAFLTVGKENNADIEIYYEDRGTGKPVLLIHGWPLNGGSWEKQAAPLLAAGHRVITYDRRGFGRSSAPSEGYDYDTLARDTATLIEKLDLRDLTIVGFSMGGGEVARYMGKYDDGRVSKVVFWSSICPALRKDGNNPEGVDPKVFDEMKEKIEKDRFDFLQSWIKMFYNHGVFGTATSSQAVLDHGFQVAAGSSYQAMLFCIDSWLEDFRDDVLSIKVPTLVIHGDADKILPIEATGERTAAMLHAEYHIVKGGPHGCNWTHATECNQVLLPFVAGQKHLK